MIKLFNDIARNENMDFPFYELEETVNFKSVYENEISIFEEFKVDVLGSEDDVDPEPAGQFVGQGGQLEGVCAAEVGLRIDDQERWGEWCVQYRSR